jgi:hypothetical protein
MQFKASLSFIYRYRSKMGVVCYIIGASQLAVETLNADDVVQHS